LQEKIKKKPPFCVSLSPKHPVIAKKR